MTGGPMAWRLLGETRTTLKNTSYKELLSLKDLVVGRIDHGEIHFINPVDLTGLPSWKPSILVSS